jgi:hypothetical protein
VCASILHRRTQPKRVGNPARNRHTTALRGMLLELRAPHSRFFSLARLSVRADRGEHNILSSETPGCRIRSKPRKPRRRSDIDSPLGAGWHSGRRHPVVADRLHGPFLRLRLRVATGCMPHTAEGRLRLARCPGRMLPVLPGLNGPLKRRGRTPGPGAERGGRRTSWARVRAGTRKSAKSQARKGNPAVRCHASRWPRAASRGPGGYSSGGGPRSVPVRLRRGQGRGS